MKSLMFLILLIIQPLFVLGQSENKDILLNDGSRIKGRVMSTTATEVTVMADFGVVRLELAKLTAESRAKLTDGTKPDVSGLLKRILELEAKVSQLQQENEQLRKNALAGTSTARPAPYTSTPATGFQNLTPTNGAATTPSSSGRQYTVSSTGKRHNSGCRYFGTGRAAGPTDGIACKICGG